MGLALRDHPLELAADTAASAAFAAAAAYAASTVFGVMPTLAALVAFGLVLAGLRQLAEPAEVHALHEFELPALPAAEHQPELLLTSEMIHQPPPLQRDELTLDDVLAEIGPDSRVVRLFDPAQVFTAGELKESIDQHLAASRTAAYAPDATQALSDALAQLRRSLR